VAATPPSPRKPGEAWVKSGTQRRRGAAATGFAKVSKNIFLREADSFWRRLKQRKRAGNLPPKTGKTQCLQAKYEVRNNFTFLLTAVMWGGV